MAFTCIAFRSIARVAIVAMALSTSGLATAQAFAQGGSSGFSIEFQDSGDGGRSFGNGQRYDRHRGWNNNSRLRCLSNREVIRSVKGYSYDRVEITRELRNERVDLQAVKGN
ncbi:MAG: hypothetical protein MO846_06380 [Candidatus Devosia symbiotica]|nr:hypothetical protein [Candidatus Devosia symbiotica]